MWPRRLTWLQTGRRCDSHRRLRGENAATGGKASEVRSAMLRSRKIVFEKQRFPPSSDWSRQKMHEAVCLSARRWSVSHFPAGLTAVHNISIHIIPAWRRQSIQPQRPEHIAQIPTADSIKNCTPVTCSTMLTASQQFGGKKKKITIYNELRIRFIIITFTNKIIYKMEYWLLRAALCPDHVTNFRQWTWVNEAGNWGPLLPGFSSQELLLTWSFLTPPVSVWSCDCICLFQALSSLVFLGGFSTVFSTAN